MLLTRTCTDNFRGVYQFTCSKWDRRFSDEQSRKGGTDITATVIENKTNCGRISISVKDTVNWDAKHMTQLLGNMKQDGTQVGILATKSFPTEALGEKMPPITYNPTRSIIVLVKPESVSLAYFALRQLVIHIYEAEKLQNLKEAETDDALETVHALIEFYNGPDFKAIISDTTTAIEEVIETKRELTSAVKGLEKTIRRQDDIEKNLNHGKEMIETNIRKIRYP